VDFFFMVEVVVVFHFWPFTGVLQEIRRDITRKVGPAGLNRDLEVCEPNKKPPRQ
jgi:hypothetical protein